MFKMPKGKYDDKTKLVDGLQIVAHDINQEFEEAFEDEGDFKPRGFTIRQRLKE